MISRDICAVVPIKVTHEAKQRLSGVLPPPARRALALAMAEDVLAALAAVPTLARVLVVTRDADAIAIARRHGAEISGEHVDEGHTGAVMGAAHRLARENFSLMEIPGDIPLVTADDIARVIAAHAAAPAFTIVPARDYQGSNTVLCSPADAVPLRFGSNSYYPHLDAARAHGIEPTIVEIPSIALDIDEPADLACLARMPSRCRARALIDSWSLDVDANGVLTKVRVG